MPYAKCPDCKRWMGVEKVHNGICYVWHGFCDACGWAKDGFGNDDISLLPQTRDEQEGDARSVPNPSRERSE